MKKSCSQDDIGVDHYVDGKSTASLGLKGFFTRYRGLALIVSPGLLVMGEPFWWETVSGWWNSLKIKFLNNDVSQAQELAANSFAEERSHLIASFIFIAFVYLLFTYGQKRTIRSLQIKNLLHDYSHETRDEICEFIDARQYCSDGSSSNEKDFHQTLDKFSHKVCDVIAQHSCKLFNDEEVGCAIRLLRTDNGTMGYKTVGRSPTMNKGRAKTTESLAPDKGIPNLLRQLNRENMGVLYYSDIPKAVLSGAYIMTENDGIYKDEVKSMIVAPINGWHENGYTLIGLLHITSRTDKILKPIHVDMVKFFADDLAATFSSFYALFCTQDGTRVYPNGDNNEHESPA